LEARELNTNGRHLLVEYAGCNFDALNDVDQIRTLMEQAARAAQMTIVASVFHPFVPQGVTGVVVLEESHLSIHTWPEIGYAAVDFYTCGSGAPEKSHDVLMTGLTAKKFEMLEIDRGLNPELTAGNCMKLRNHIKPQKGSPTTPRRVRVPLRVNA
jgi:S-adenosylmethionine decarboxylase proenzyme